MIFNYILWNVGNHVVVPRVYHRLILLNFYFGRPVLTPARLESAIIGGKSWMACVSATFRRRDGVGTGIAYRPLFWCAPPPPGGGLCEQKFFPRFRGNLLNENTCTYCVRGRWCSHAVRDFGEGRIILFSFCTKTHPPPPPPPTPYVSKTIALQCIICILYYGRTLYCTRKAAFDRLKVFADICRMANGPIHAAFVLEDVNRLLLWSALPQYNNGPHNVYLADDE